MSLDFTYSFECVGGRESHPLLLYEGMVIIKYT